MSSAMMQAEWVVSSTGSANGAATATKAAPAIATAKYVVLGVDVSFNAVVTTASTLVIKDGTNTIWTAQIPTGAAYLARTFIQGLAITPGNACSATIAASGTSVTATVNLDGILVD